MSAENVSNDPYENASDHQAILATTERDGPRQIQHHRLVSEEPPGADRRQHERFELLVEVSLSRSEESEVLKVINISAGGVLLLNDRNVEFSVGEHLRVQFDAPELTSAFSIDAKVIRVVAPTAKSGAVAAMWTSSDPAASTGLSEVLWSLSQRR